MSRPTRWSYSQWSTWRDCPAQYAYSYIHKLPWPVNAAAQRGTLLHTMAEDYVTGKVADVPFDLKKISKFLKDLKERQAIAEQTWMLNKQWSPVADKSVAWIKAIVDVHYVEGDVLHLRDYKSGKEYATHNDQLELYGIIGLQMYPLVKRADLGAIYIDGGFSGAEGSIIRPMLPKLIEKWDQRARDMENDQTFIANPGYKCQWCPYAQGKGGPCADSAKAGQ